MNIANGGAGQKKIGKIRQHSSFTLRGEIFFLLFAQAKATEASSKCFSGRNSGPLSRAFTILTFPKDRRQRFFFQNNSTTLLDAIFAGSNIILLLLELVRGEATTHKATID